MPGLSARHGFAPLALMALACDQHPAGDVAFDDPRQSTFVSAPDVGGGTDVECDLYAQNCGPGDKCMPWAKGGGTWNSTRCSPVADHAGAPGEPCVVEEHFASGHDDCERGAICASVDPSTNQGICYALPIGSAGHRRCPDAFEVVLLRSPVDACVPTCNPLAPECPVGMGCYRRQDGFRFACEPDNSGAGGAVRDGCEFATVCEPGLACIEGDGVPGCESPGCCSPFCDLDDPECPAGTDCHPWDPPVIVPGQESAGICRV